MFELLTVLKIATQHAVLQSGLLFSPPGAISLVLPEGLITAMISNS